VTDPPGRPDATPGASARGVPGLAQVSVEERDGVTVAAITGEVDISNASEVADALVELPNLALGLIVDLRGVDYLDSTGVSLLHELALRLRRRSQRLIVVCPVGCPPRRVLELTALPSHSPVLDDLPSAIRAMASSAV
jgi:anti-anti-sigma factor